MSGSFLLFQLEIFSLTESLFLNSFKASVGSVEGVVCEDHAEGKDSSFFYIFAIAV